MKAADIFRAFYTPRPGVAQNMKSKTGVGWILRLVLAVSFVTIGASSVQAQIEVGRVTGTVTDQSGAIINGAKVTLINRDTGVSATKITADGVYAFPAVQPGRYSVQVESTGFATHVVNDVDVHVQETNTIDVQLNPGKVNEQVVVNTTTPLLQTESAEVGQTINSVQVDS